MKMRAKDLVSKAVKTLQSWVARVSRKLRHWRTIIQILSYLAIIINAIAHVIRR
jgi:hypothetical protein